MSQDKFVIDSVLASVRHESINGIEGGLRRSSQRQTEELRSVAAVRIVLLLRLPGLYTRGEPALHIF